MKSWAFLQPGDIVDVVAPSFSCSSKELSRAVRVLKSWGLRPRVPKNMMMKDFIFAQTDENRLKFLVRAIQAPDSKAIWCVRGGYGSQRLLPKLQGLRASGPSKVLLGYSDITALHFYFNQVLKWPSLYSMVLDGLGKKSKSDPTAKELRQTIEGTTEDISFSGLKPLNSPARKSRKIRAPILGGTLTLVQNLLGTPFEPKLRGSILFLEDIDERAYRIDRMLLQIHQSGVLSGVKAIVLGDFVGGREPNGKNLVWSEWRRFSDATTIPVLRGLPVGHGKIQRTLPLGVVSELQTGTSGRLICPTGGRL